MKNKGGSAFPEIISDKDKDGQYDTYSYGGMSLRDYFAAKAMRFCGAGIFGIDATDVKARQTFAKNVAIISYEISDAMLAEREKEQ
jgi:hypothetical protein